MIWVADDTLNDVNLCKSLLYVSIYRRKSIIKVQLSQEPRSIQRYKDKKKEICGLFIYLKGHIPSFDAAADQFIFVIEKLICDNNLENKI